MSNSHFLISYKKQILFGLLIVLAVFVFFLIIFIKGFLPNVDFSGSSNSLTAMLEVKIGGQKRAFEGEVIESMTILDAIQASAMAGNILFDYFLSEDGKITVKSLDGYEIEKAEKQPSVRLNSTPIETGKIHQVPIKAGDRIEIIAE